MWMNLLVMTINSNMAKALIGMLIKKLLEHKSDGITKDVIEMFLDGAVASKSNSLTAELVQPLKDAL